MSFGWARSASSASTPTPEKSSSSWTRDFRNSSSDQSKWSRQSSATPAWMPSKSSEGAQDWSRETPKGTPSKEECSSWRQNSSSRNFESSRIFKTPQKEEVWQRAGTVRVQDCAGIVEKASSNNNVKFTYAERLPIDDHRHAILARIRRDRVTIIYGETGCGKSSRIPQYLIEDAAERREVGFRCGT
jgi:HrpA-like RNA helicase